MSLYRRLKIRLGQQVSSVLRNYPWPIKKKILAFPPIPAGEGDRKLIVLTHERMWLESLWCCWSWMRHVSGVYRLELFMDGNVPEYLSTPFARLFPGGRIRPVGEVQLPDNLLPDNFRSFVRDDPYGRKASLILESQRHDDILYSDADILAFRKPTEMLPGEQGKTRPAYCYEQHTACQEWVGDKLRAANIDILNHFNAGLLFIPKSSLDLGLAFRIIEGWPPEETNHYIEQSMFSGLLSAAGAEQFSQDKYSVSWQGMWHWEQDIDYEPLHVRHFCGTVRHRMFLKGMPYLMQVAACENPEIFA